MLIANADPGGWVPVKSDLPPELQASVQRHQEHLAALVVSLRAAGVDEGLIDASVKQLLTSYGAELTEAMRTLVRRPAND